MEALVATSIHDIKNSLHALNSWLGEADRVTPSPALSEARALANHINGQLVQLLALYRENEDSLRLNIDDRDLPNFLEELALEPTGRHDGSITVTYDMAGANAIGTWAFDAYQIKLILADTLRNAVRHARSAVTLSLSSPATGGVEFQVTDDGPGFSAALLSGEQAAMSDSGSGLGLRFARLIAGRHRTPDGRVGEILLDNQGINGGARLTLRLP